MMHRGRFRPILTGSSWERTGNNPETTSNDEAWRDLVIGGHGGEGGAVLRPEDASTSGLDSQDRF